MEVQPATRDKLGGVIVGKGFSITEEGVLTVDENERDNLSNSHARGWSICLRKLNHGGGDDD